MTKPHFGKESAFALLSSGGYKKGPRFAQPLLGCFSLLDGLF